MDEVIFIRVECMGLNQSCGNVELTENGCLRWTIELIKGESQEVKDPFVGTESG